MRETTKHNPRLDDQMKHEIDSLLKGGIESRSEEGRLLEDSTDRTFAGGTEADARSSLARNLDPGIFPANKKSIIENAKKNQAQDSVISLLEKLPPKTQFQNTQKIWEALGGSIERR